MKRKIIAASMITALAVSSVVPAYAAPTISNLVSSKAEERIPILIDGLEIDSDQPPIIIEGRTLVPLRVIFEALGATVNWNNDTRSVIATRGDTSLYLAIGSNTLYKNGYPVYLDVPGQIINDRTMVPLRAVSESFEANVVWDNDTRTVYVDTNIESTPEEPEKPDVDEPEEPEIPDVDDPDISDPTEPEDPNPPIETPEEPDNTPVEPDYPEVTPPEEQQPSVDEQEKNIAYNTALLQLKNGYSYEAYYGFLKLGDYKDSKKLLEQALWLNRLSMNITMWNYSHLNNHNWSNYPNMTDEEIYNTLVNKTFYTPGAQSPQIGATQFCENGISYALGNSTTGYSRYEQGTWYVANHHIIENGPTIYDQYDHRFIKITDGLYANIICDLLEHDILCDLFVFYFDASSPIGQGLRAFYDRYDYVNWTTQSRPDANGIYYLY